MENYAPGWVRRTEITVSFIKNVHFKGQRATNHSHSSRGQTGGSSYLKSRVWSYHLRRIAAYPACYPFYRTKKWQPSVVKIVSAMFSTHRGRRWAIENCGEQYRRTDSVPASSHSIWRNCLTLTSQRQRVKTSSYLVLQKMLQLSKNLRHQAHSHYPSRGWRYWSFCQPKWIVQQTSAETTKNTETASRTNVDNR